MPLCLRASVAATIVSPASRLSADSMVPATVQSLAAFIKKQLFVLGPLAHSATRWVTGSATGRGCARSQYRILIVLPTRVMGARRSAEPYAVRMRIVHLVCYHLAGENFDVMTRAANVQTKLSSAKYVRATANV